MAARLLPIAPIADHLVHELAALPPDTTVLLRKPKTRPPEPFEATVSEVCESLGIPIEWWFPEGRGREATYKRDVDMVRDAVMVVGYFDSETVMEGGTGHVLERAIADEIPCQAWVWDRPEEALGWLGGND